MARRKKAKQQALAPVSTRKGVVLALDVSSSCVGWATFTDGKLSDYGKFFPEGEVRQHGQKLCEFDHWLRSRLNDLQPVAFVVEAPYPGRNKNAVVLFLYFGIVLAAYFDHYGVEMPRHYRIGPRSVKRALKLPSLNVYWQRKRQMVEWANTTYHLDLRYKKSERPNANGKISDDDIADAIAVAHTFLLRDAADVGDDADDPLP